MEIKKITDPAFRKYGRLVTNVDFTELIEALKEHTSIPEGVAYEPSVPALEATATAAQLKTIGNLAFGLMLPVLAGYIGEAIGDRPALAVGFVGGLMAANGKSGFLGALVAGFDSPS